LRALVQRVARASVSVAGQQVASIGPGLLILLGVRQGDTDAEAAWLAEKVANLRIFEDEAGKMNRSALEAGVQALVVSQFTLYGDARKGRRPSFTEAATPDQAEPLVAGFTRHLENAGLPVKTGVFRAHMLVEILNDGPVTLLLER
jgi:D-tyrosyl-tRNA(Tyr) deacylase